MGEEISRAPVALLTPAGMSIEVCILAIIWSLVLAVLRLLRLACLGVDVVADMLVEAVILRKRGTNDVLRYGLSD